MPIETVDSGAATRVQQDRVGRVDGPTNCASAPAPNCCARLPFATACSTRPTPRPTTA
jgi:hypothetical protein